MGKRIRQAMEDKAQLLDSTRQPSQGNRLNGNLSNAIGSHGGRKPRGLVSQNNKQWQITTFQKGVSQANSDPKNGEILHLELVPKLNRIEPPPRFRVIKVDEPTKTSQEFVTFSADFMKLYVQFPYHFYRVCRLALLTALQYCGNEIGLLFRGTTGNHGYLTITYDKDIEEVRNALQLELNPKDVHLVDE